jgi:hypothetical protein
LLFTEPGCAIVEAGDVNFGRAALERARIRPNAFFDRYWHDMSDEPMPRAAGEFVTAADLVHAHLGALGQRYGDEPAEFVLTVPGVWDKSQLGLLLGLADEQNIPIRGLVDASVAAVRREYPGRDLWHLEVTRHAACITRIEQDGRALAGERHMLAGSGLDAYERGCVNYIARRFLEKARFDPMHDARCEQSVYDALYAWLAQLARQARAEIEVEFSGNVFTAPVERAGITEAVARASEPVVRRFRTLLEPDRPVAIQVSACLADIPGAVDALAELPDCEVFVQEPGASALGAQRRIGSLPAESGYRLVTSMPWDQPAVERELPEKTPAQGKQSPAPTHVLFDGHAYRIDEHIFTVGSELAGGEFGLSIGSGNAGISRRHFSVQAEAGRVLLHDHSRFGTLLNGFRVEGSAVLRPGDVVQAGTPPIELTMIVEVSADG